MDLTLIVGSRRSGKTQSLVHQTATALLTHHGHVAFATTVPDMANQISQDVLLNYPELMVEDVRRRLKPVSVRRDCVRPDRFGRVVHRTGR